jgi:hypothetical protein
MDKKLRKRETLLADAGAGVILFVVWSIAKVNLYLGVSGFFLDDVNRYAVENGINKTFLVAFIGVIFIGVLLWQLCTRLYIGVCAIKESRGKSKGWVYLVVAAALLISEVQTFWGMLMPGTHDSIGNAIMAVCLEAASVFVLLELLVSGIYVKYLRKQKKA